MDNLKIIIEGFRFSYTQALTVVLVLIIASLLNYLLLRFSLTLIDQQMLWIRQIRYWVPVIRIILWCFAIYLCIDILSPPKEIIFAIATSAGVAIGLAAQDLVKNLFGSIVAWSDRMYQEGDRITIGEVDGIVQSIGLRSTKIRAFNDSLITVPNSQLLNETVSNASSGTSIAPVQTDFFLPINTDSQKAMECSRLATLSSDLFEPSKPIVVLASDILSGDIPLTRIRVKAYVRNPRYEKLFITDITKRAKKLFLKHGLYRNDSPFIDQDAPPSIQPT